MIRVILPFHLRTIIGKDDEVEFPATLSSISAILDELEARHPTLRGTLRDHTTGKRRPFIHFFACKEDLTHEPEDARLPDDVLSGKEPLMIVGAMAGG